MTVYHEIAAFIALRKVICSPDEIFIGLFFDTPPVRIQTAMHADRFRSSAKDFEVFKEFLMLLWDRIKKNIVWKRQL